MMGMTQTLLQCPEKVLGRNPDDTVNNHHTDLASPPLGLALKMK